MRYARRHSHDFRVVLDLHQAAPVNTMLLKPDSNSANYRLVVQLAHKGARTAPVMTTAQLDKQLRDVVVVIDPGHGGKDPGAIGKHRTREKDVVLSIGHRLHRLLSKQKGIRPVLTRSRDHYLHLHERVKIAERHKADLFVSIHADANRDRRCTGSSVYILSDHGASSVMARRLAARENSADRIGGVNLSNKNKTLSSVLLDLSQTATIQASTDLGKDMLSNLEEVVGLLSPRVERAGFAVLKSPDIPSALVETAFISNPREERKLRTPAFQHQVALAIHDGIHAYFRRNAPPGTMLSAINRGIIAG
jgi:N-acetylmuramoyl-L-alanine amidase